MTGWIVYEEADALKNQEYVKMFTVAAAKYHVMLQLIYIQSDNGTPGFILHQHQGEDSVLIQSSDLLTNLPDFVINRSRNAVFAFWLEANKIRVFNPAIVTEICNDKHLTYEFIRKHDITIPDTVYTAEDAVASLSFPFVVKPACGHGGACVTLVHNHNELTSTIAAIRKKYACCTGVVFQRCASDIGRDLRVYVLGGNILASIMRSAYETTPSLSDSVIDIRSNYSLGHNAVLHTLSTEEMTLVNRIIPLLPFDCIGIDFIYEKGHPIFNEIEDAVGARMLYANSDIDIVKEYMKYILTCINHRINPNID